ncbi:Signal transduction response regulator [Cinnamomum micranthum f. kanehirae]|uniref:Ethylene receptor n=1 Tax=Cinnamomum micranthum f. kanehirae TaxID=337451 RepID=A0A3S4P639_9MAGN|nr:Signal transduction response regulator [Cinnamomum micranthum f. kanehirae]
MSSSAFSFPRCICADEETQTLWTFNNILQCQKSSDFLISLAYFSIPLELFYFVSCSSIFPFKWIFIQFGAFIVFCGLTHFLNVFTYAPHSFQLMLSLTVFKFLTALVSCATSITLATLLPQMLRVMVREGLLRKKTRELRREVGMMKRLEEAGWHVRMLTQEIRRSLDRHMILHTTLVELSKVLFLQNCAVWMPADENAELILTHELHRRDGASDQERILICDPDVVEIVGRKEPVVLRPGSRLWRGGVAGAAAAVRLQMLRVADFKRGTPEVVDARYAVLVLVLRPDVCREWGTAELDLVEAVADQVAVALSHAAVLEESMAMREKLMEQNADLKRAGNMTLLASEARSAFRKVMSGEMAGRVRSISAVVAVLQRDERLNRDQLTIIDGMSKGALILSALIDDALNSCSNQNSRRHEQLDLSPFSLHSLLKEAVGIAKLLCNFRGFSFHFDISKQVPDFVIGDEKRLLKAVMYMVGNVAGYGDRGDVVLRVCTKGGSVGDKNLAWKQPMQEEFVQLVFKVSRVGSSEDELRLLEQRDGKRSGKTGDAQGLSFAVCGKLAQLMHGSISVSSNPQGQQKSMNLTVRLQLKRSLVGLAKARYTSPKTPEILLNGMNILLADGDSFNRFIARKLLEKTGCHITVVSSWYQCLETLHLKGREFHLLLLDLCIFEENIHEMTALIRRLHSESWLLIVAMTSKEVKDSRDRCLQNGMNGIIGKPVILQEMVDELQRIIQKAAQVPSPLLHTEQKS